MAKKLDHIAQDQDRSRSALIRRLIANYIEEFEDINDALKARKNYEKNPKSAVTLTKFMKDLKVSKKELARIDLD